MFLVYGSGVWSPDTLLDALRERLGADAERTAVIDARSLVRKTSASVMENLIGRERAASAVVPLGAVDWEAFEERRRAAIGAALEQEIVAASIASKHALIIGADANPFSDIPAMAKNVFYVTSDVNLSCNKWNEKARKSAESQAGRLAAFEAAAAAGEALDARFYAFVLENDADFGPAGGRWPASPASAADEEASAAIRANERGQTVLSVAQTADALAPMLRAEPTVLNLEVMRETATVKKLLEALVALMTGLGAGWYFEGYRAAADALLARENVSMLDLAQSQFALYLGILAQWYKY
jgi:hypothetical protein